MSAYHIEANKIRTTRILNAKTESPTVKTFTFKDEMCAKAKPGQFLMLWVPGVDEIPLGILDADEDGAVSVVVKNVGEASGALHRKKNGDIIGVRGPFGNGFTERKGKMLMVGGGTGVAPLFFLARRLASDSLKPFFVLGAKTKDELLYLNELKEVVVKAGGELISTTEDGSCGAKGLCTEPVERLLAEEEFDVIYACGPEPMIRKVFDLSRKYRVALEASLERIMRCAVGLCGSCVVGKYRVCRDGPVFTSRQLDEVREEFGFSKRDFDGRKIPL